MAKKKSKSKKGGDKKNGGGDGPKQDVTTPTVSTDEVEETTKEGTWIGLLMRCLSIFLFHIVSLVTCKPRGCSRLGGNSKG
jgi:hypothetical protein